MMLDKDGLSSFQIHFVKICFLEKRFQMLSDHTIYKERFFIPRIRSQILLYYFERN
jgi:hypothetical protein